jgi:hypothetical protein
MSRQKSSRWSVLLAALAVSSFFVWLTLAGASDTPARADLAMISPLPTPALAGKVILERRASNAGTEVCLDGDCVFTAEDGRYEFDELVPGLYFIAVRHTSYLPSWRTLVVTEGVLTLPDVTLLGGDVNRDDRIDLSDANLVGQAWNSSSGDATWDERADVTDDGTVNILDMVAIQYNWDETAPVHWPTTVAR